MTKPQPVLRVDTDGNKAWFLNGKLHREDGPAIEYADGYKIWLLNDNYHREAGPAIEYTNGDKSWFLKGKKLSKEDHAYYVERMGEFLLEFGADL